MDFKTFVKRCDRRGQTAGILIMYQEFPRVYYHTRFRKRLKWKTFDRNGQEITDEEMMRGKINGAKRMVE